MVCPSHIPLVDFYRYAKSEIRARATEKQAADLARERHEFRLFRQTREQTEKAEKLVARAQSQRAAPATQRTPDTDAKQALIAAALARVQAKKIGAAPRNTEHLPAHAQQQIDDIEARRVQIQAALPPSHQKKNG